MRTFPYIRGQESLTGFSPRFQVPVYLSCGLLTLNACPQKPVLPLFAGVKTGSFSFYKQLEMNKNSVQSQAVHLEHVFCTYLSLRSLTALTSVENSISMTVFFFRSSQIITRTVQRLH